MRRTPILLAVLVTVLAVLPSGAAAQGESGYKVTIAARECPEYTDITANRARNDIQESLEDLGEDTSYSAGEPIDPAKEAADQPNCTPLPNWRFTLGQGYLSRAVTGPWGSLSIVTNPYDTDIVTLPETELLDSTGSDTKETIEGAVTIELTKDQLERAASGNSLWLQGGTTTDPILDKVYPGKYGFGALRCAIDNLNGDNVEWISFPAGSEHVFCYAYYVTPPPTSGRIVISKRVEGGASQTFNFDGNLSFNEGGKFSLTLNNEESASTSEFFRAAGQTWTAHELVPAGWSLTDISCVTRLGSTWDGDLASAEARITLQPRDLVTCTFTNALTPPDGQLFIEKITRGGTGLFGFEIFPNGADQPTAKARARTEEPNVPMAAEPSPLTLGPGKYRIDELLPRSRAGEWRLKRVFCNAKPVGVRRPRARTNSVDVTLEPGEGAACTFVNRFVPNGAIVIDKATVGGTGTAGFTITPLRDPGISYSKSATTREPGEPRRARGDRTNRLPLGRYVIQEHNAAPDDDRKWTLTEVLCDNVVRPFEEGRVVVRLTRRNPRLKCLFVNVLNKTPVPPVPPGPGPGPGPDPGGPDLVVTKTVDRPVAGFGEKLTYTIRVENRGNMAAEDVVLADQPGLGERAVAARALRGRPCTVRRIARRLYVCRVGNLAPGEGRVYQVDMLVTTSSRALVNNLAAAGSATAESNVRNNIDGARARTRRLACPAGAATRGSVPARAAC